MRLMNWKDEAYLRRAEDGHFIPLEEYDEYSRRQKRFLGLSTFEYKLLLIAGVGFFLDSYDLFIINLVSPVWEFEYWNGHYPSGLRGLVNSGANIGNIFGQLLFGFVGDTLGRKFVYGKELIVTIIGMVLVISLPNSIPTPTLKMIWLFCWRLFMGIGIGGDYPMSAAVVSERGHLRRRGSLLALIFSNQGWGTLAGSIATIIILACFENALNVEGEYGQLDAVWRIQMGIALVPALAVLPFRLTMPEGLKYLESLELNRAISSTSRDSAYTNTPRCSEAVSPTSPANHGNRNIFPVVRPPRSRKGKWDAFVVYFKEWRHLKLLIGTASTWFFLDIAFYGVNLNQSVILDDIGFSEGSNEYHTLMKNAIGNLIIALAGYVPGYFVTVGLVEILGRKWIQIQGFLACALLFGVLAGDYHHLGTAAKFVCLALAQFFFNFGANATTFIFSGEVYPSRVRGSAFGVSAAAGKTGAILAALLFNFLSSDVIGLPDVLWIFFACNILGAIATVVFLPETKGRDADLVDYKEALIAQENASVHAPPTPELRQLGRD